MIRTVSTNSFSYIYIGAIIFGIVNACALTVYAIALSAWRYEDDINDPFHTWEWGFTIASTSFWVPLLFSWYVWTSYKSSIAYTIHFVVCLAFLAWGIVHMGFMIYWWTVCNDFNGLDPKVPHCINRMYPAKQNPDVSFQLAFWSLAANVVCAGYWLYFGTELKTVSNILIQAELSSTGAAFRSDVSIGAKYGSKREYNESEHTNRIAKQHRKSLQLISESIAHTIRSNPEKFPNYTPSRHSQKVLVNNAKTLILAHVAKRERDGKSGTGADEIIKASGLNVGGLKRVVDTHNELFGEAVTHL